MMTRQRAAKRPRLSFKPPSLVLPIKVINIIASFCDHSTTVSLGGVSRAIREVAEPYIWRELYLTLPERDTRLTSLPDTGGDMEALLKAVEHMLVSLQMAGKKGMAELVRGVMKSGSSKRWAAVRELKMATTFGAVPSLVPILKFLSPRLETLHLVCQTSGKIPGFAQTIDFGILHSKISFPNLTKIHIGPSSILFSEIIPYLCNVSPNLTSAEIHLNDDTSNTDFWGPDIPPFPPFIGNTKIQRLILRLNPYLLDQTIRAGCRYDVHPGVRGLLYRSQQLRQLSITCKEEEGRDVPDVYWMLCDTVMKLEQLEDLHWSDKTDYLPHYASEHPRFKREGFQALRRVILGMDRWSQVFDDIPEYLNLEILQFMPKTTTPPNPTPPPTPYKHKSYSPAQRMMPCFIDTLIGAPKLRIIHVGQSPLAGFQVFNQVDPAIYTGFVRSIRHGKSAECLHVRLWLDYYEISDQACETPPKSAPVEEVYYRAVDGTGRVKRFGKRKASWQNFTAYHGEPVPMKILEKMMKVEKKRMEDWDMRGMEVGETAWKVLEEWYAGVAR